jgi:hypothetical protein
MWRKRSGRSLAAELRNSHSSISTSRRSEFKPKCPTHREVSLYAVGQHGCTSSGQGMATSWSRSTSSARPSASAPIREVHHYTDVATNGKSPVVLALEPDNEVLQIEIGESGTVPRQSKGIFKISNQHAVIQHAASLKRSPEGLPILWKEIRPLFTKNNLMVSTYARHEHDSFHNDAHS